MMKSFTKYLSEKLIISPSHVSEKLVISPSHVSEKLVINKDYKVTDYNSFTDVDEMYVIIFNTFNGRGLLFNTYKVYDHSYDEEKSIVKISKAESIFNRWAISASAMYDKNNDVAYISNDKSTFIMISDNNTKKLELLLSLMNKMITTDYSIKSILDELGIDSEKRFIRPDLYQPYRFNKNDFNNEYNRTKEHLKQHLDNINKKK